MNITRKIMGLCTGACLPEHSQPWALPNIGPSLDSIQLDINQHHGHAVQSRTQQSTWTFHPRERSTLYECTNALYYKMTQFIYLSFTIKLQSNKCVTLVMNLFNSCYWAVIYRVVHIFTLLHKMLCGGFQFLDQKHKDMYKINNRSY